MSLQEIEWTESEGESDENLVLDDYDDDSDQEPDLDRSLLKSSGSGGSGSVTGRTRRARDEELDPEVEEAYQEARNLYTQGDYDAALVLLEEAIKHEAQSKLLFNLLVTIHEERHDFEKALLARVAVAHLDKRDKDTWIDIAERSVQLGHLAQAAVFFQHVSRLDRDQWQLLKTRADLHTQLGQHSQALSLLQRLRAKFFSRGDSVGLHAEQKTQILLEVAKQMKELGRIDEATQMYLHIFYRSLGVDTSAPPEVELDWQNLNILSELLFDQKQFAKVTVIIKDGARWINGRGDEEIWQQFDIETDAEFDARRHALIARMPPSVHTSIDPDQYVLPIDIRIWLLESRLKQIPSHLLLNNHSVAIIEQLPAVADALVHLDILRESQPVDAYSDLYRRAAVAFFEARLYSEARELYIALTDIGHETMEEYINMTVQVAKCEMELHNIQRAEDLYKYVLDRDSTNQEALVAIGEIYAATNRVAESRGVLQRLEEVRLFADEAGSPGGHTDDSTIAARNGEAGTSANIFVDDSAILGRQRSASSRPTRAERAELERAAQQRADTAFAGLSRYQSGVEARNTVATMEWLRYADELIGMFAAHRKFFPANRHKEFFSFDGSSNSTVDERIAKLRLAQEDEAHEDASTEIDAGLAPTRGELEESYIWRGQPLSMWFIVLMTAALVHARYGSGDRAQQVVTIAHAANVFALNSQRDATMALVGLSCAWISQDPELIGEKLRHMQTQNQFNTTTYQLYMALLASGKRAAAVFGSSNNQKFFLRQIKALDSVVHKKHVPGMAKVLDPQSAPGADIPQLLMLYVDIMLLGPSYAPALTYLIRTRAQLPNHPLVLLVYGVVQMHRVTQRTSPNRHTQLLEGLSFMQDYAAARIDSVEAQVEANYNLGRFFHGVGLLTPAVRYYELALQQAKGIPEMYDIGRETAYNLQLIYLESGNPGLSVSIIDEYLTI